MRVVMYTIHVAAVAPVALLTCATDVNARDVTVDL
jgi:hypothetical protein